MATSVQITLDCADPDRLARFWAEALGYKIQDPPEGFDSWEAFLEKIGVPKEQWNDYEIRVVGQTYTITLKNIAERE